MLRALNASMIAKNLDDVMAYQKALAAADAVSELLKHSGFSRDFDLKDQLSRSSDRVAPLIAEGFGQLSDRHVAVYLGRARGSALETLGHLRKAVARRFISESEHAEVTEMYDHIGRMLTRWIGYLQRSDRKRLG